MLTHDEIATRLRSSFEHATADLHYTRTAPPPRPRAAFVLAPAATLVGAAAVGAVVLGQPSAAPARRPATVAPSVVASPTKPSTPSATVATSRIHLAGYTFSVPKAAPGAAADLARVVFSDVAKVPANARRLPALPQAPQAKAWVGRYPGTSRNALWFVAPTRNEGHLAAIISNTWTQDQLASIWATGVPDPR